MDLLKQCQQWFEQDEAQKVIDTLEAIPAEERTPELDSELAKAYIAVAHIGEREPFEKALELLAPHEEYFAEDHCWNYRIALAYYCLDEEGPALRYFEKALKARPGDKDTQEYIDDCRRRLSLPRFEKNFRERTQEAWAAFSQIEAELRQIIDTDETHQRGEELVEKCGNALKTALRDTSFELGFNGEKYELILSPEGLRSRLFPLVYFQKQAPESVLEHWNIWVGRQPCEGFELRAGEIEVRAEDVQVWAEKTADNQMNLVLYCEKLTPLLKEEPDRGWWALSMLVDQTIGEVSAIALIAGFDVSAQPKDEPATPLTELPELVQSMGLSLWRDGSDYLENSYIAYELEPIKDPEADWRLDVYTGSCRLPVMINEYMAACTDTVDEYHRDGIAAGFLCYPVDSFTGEERSNAILDFRDALQESILDKAGAETVTFLGGATGLYYGYLDLITWDLPAVLDAAKDFFADSCVAQGAFHVFRRDVGAVRLWEREPEPEIHEETGSLLSAEDIETLAAFDEGTAGYFGKMLRWLEDFIKTGVEEERFSEKQAHQDLQIALWYAFASNNLDDYIHYYRTVEWMKASEKNAAGCATWYYRYSVALMYCGRLEEALEYAERGAQEEPDYPWIWLQVGKLRAHFGNKAGALDAVKQGLKLEPGDYEFLTLKKEIEAGAPLEQMEYHWINPDADQTLQQGLDADADDKQRSISCITVDQEGLEHFWQIFGPKPEECITDSPYTQFPYPAQDRTIDLVFQMNEAGMSKLHSDWLEELKGWIQSGRWLDRNHPDGRAAHLDTVLVGLDYRMGLLYKLTEDDAYFQIFLNPDGTEQEGTFWSSEENRVPEVYTEEEMSAVEQHIKNTFGEFENVFHELVSPDIHVDICVVPPSDERDYYTLVTMGMGAHRMNVPEELAEYKLERAELAIALPPDWKLDEESLKDERWYWPIGLLKVLARLPISNDTWLGFGHTMDKQSPFAEDTKLCAAILVGPQDVVWNGGEVCTLPSSEEVNFYQVIPLYHNEMEYKMEHDADALLEKMAGISFVVNPTRQNAITRGTLAEEEFTGDMDDAAWHLESIQEKGLPVNEINAYNHMAIYLRWCIEHDLMSAEFMERYWEQVQPFMADLSRADLRGFIRDQLKGQLFGALFNKEGAAFAGYYYGEADSPYFPSDIDNYALEYFGSEQYYSDKFQNEAYLFIPFDENYYQAMAKVMKKRFVNWQGQSFDEATLEPSNLAEAMMEYLDCECTYFPSMTDDDPIMSAYNYAKRESVKEGFVPVLIKADDEILWECLIMNSDPDSDGQDDYAFDPEKVAEYRKKMLSAPVENSKAVLEEMIGQRKEEAEDDDMDWDEEILGEMEGGYDNRRFSSYWNSDNNMTYPLILAKIPVKNPWEIFAYLPFGGWNECPDTPELMAVAKYWFEQHGAVPAAMSHDELEFLLPAPVSEKEAIDVAVELYGFCPDVIDQGPEDATVGALADVLRQSTVWYFWWD